MHSPAHTHEPSLDTATAYVVAAPSVILAYREGQPGALGRGMGRGGWVGGGRGAALTPSSRNTGRRGGISSIRLRDYL